MPASGRPGARHLVALQLLNYGRTLCKVLAKDRGKGLPGVRDLIAPPEASWRLREA